MFEAKAKASVLRGQDQESSCPYMDAESLARYNIVDIIITL